MKKQFYRMGLIAAIGCLIGGALKAQVAIPNGNFEDWSSKSILFPTGYISSDLERPESAFGTCERSVDAQSGSFAITLTTKKQRAEDDPQPGYFVNFMGDGEPSQWSGGIPYNEKPTGIKGYYKADIKAGDSAFFLLVFSKNGQNIGTYFFKIGGKTTTYTLFNFTLSPALTQTPDSLIFGAVSSDITNEIAVEGSMIQLDNISLEGVVNQPAMLNGSFEKWSTATVENPAHWIAERENSFENVKSTDTHKGNFAIKIKSYLDLERNKINESSIGNGYYTPTGMEGGFPYSNNLDTLIFWYKYITNGNSKAALYVTMKKAGAIVYQRRLELDPWNNGFKLIEFPLDIELASTPDTLILLFQSLRNDVDKDNLNNAGSVLYLDEVQLASARLKTGLKTLWGFEKIQLYPNPVTSYLSVSISKEIMNQPVDLVLFNQLGQEVHRTKVIGSSETIQIPVLPAGFYNCSFFQEGELMHNHKLMVK